LNGNKRKREVCFLYWFFRELENLSRILASGVQNFIPLVHDSIIIIGSGFSIKNLNFSFLGANISIFFVGSQSVSVEVHIKSGGDKGTSKAS
jgi:hypothetical protein